LVTLTALRSVASARVANDDCPKKCPRTQLLTVSDGRQGVDYFDAPQQHH
jgi:hypothetical protein